MSYFNYFKSSKNNQWYFNFKGNNHEIVMSSTDGYVNEQGCLNGIQSVKINAPHDIRYDRLTSVNNQYYFRLKAANGEILTKSEEYTSSQNRENAIALVKRDAPSAPVYKAEYASA
jgi:uncharacterized protein YegP (UPF0339 family)